MQLHIEPLPYSEALEESKAYFLSINTVSKDICSQYYQYYRQGAILASNDYRSRHYNSCIYILQYTLWKFPAGPNKNVGRIERYSGDWNIIINTFEAHAETVRGIKWKMLILCIDTLHNNSNSNLPIPYILSWTDGCLSR